jgi:hypothetical protein
MRVEGRVFGPCWKPAQRFFIAHCVMTLRFVKDFILVLANVPVDLPAKLVLRFFTAYIIGTVIQVMGGETSGR